MLPFGLRPVAAAEFVPPPGDGLVNVKADCGAKGDGASDDTEALREAFEAGKARPGKHGAARAIWLPAGTYLVREPIRVGDKKKFIAGQDQTNTESYEHQPHILNDGGTLFICGYKIEKDRTNVGTVNGGFTEVLGGLLYKNRQRGDMVPAFTNRDSNVTISIGHYGVKYDSLVEEIRAGVTRNLTPAILGGQWVPLYSGWTKRPGAGREPKE
jgi:hypothetical protein